MGSKSHDMLCNKSRMMATILLRLEHVFQCLFLQTGTGAMLYCVRLEVAKESDKLVIIFIKTDTPIVNVLFPQWLDTLSLESVSTFPIQLSPWAFYCILISFLAILSEETLYWNLQRCSQNKSPASYMRSFWTTCCYPNMPLWREKLLLSGMKNKPFAVHHFPDSPFC